MLKAKVSARDRTKIRLPRGSGTTRKKKLPGEGSDEFWNMRLYVAGQTTRSTTAISNLRRICEEHLVGRYDIEIIDLMRNPEMARIDQIVAIPTLVKKLPVPVRRIIGDLSATERVLVSLDLLQR